MKTKSQIGKKDKIVENIVVFAVMFIEAVFIFLFYKNTVINSDVANHILEAKDVLHGNILYRDWNLSQISFLFSDIVIYSIGYLIYGVSRNAALLCFAIANIITQILLYYICVKGKGYDLLRKIIVLLVIIFPSCAFLRTNTVHFGAWIYCIICISIYVSLAKEQDEKIYKKKRIALIIVSVLGIFSDFLVFLCGLLSCMLYSVIRIYTKEKREIKEFKTPATCVYSLVIAYALEFLYFMIGGANRVGTVAGLEFVSVSQWGENFVRFIEFLLGSFGADFTGKKAFLPDNILRCFNALLLLLALNYFIMTVVHLVQKKEEDILSTILAIGIIVETMIFIFTNRSLERYSLLIPLSLYILLARNINTFEMWSRHNIKINRVFAVATIVMALFGRIYDIAANMKIPYDDPREELAAFLVDNNLECGYAYFWDASICTILSEEKVRVRHIEYGSHGMSEYIWFNKNSWYNEEAHFVILHSDPDNTLGPRDYWGIVKDNVVSWFGAPDNVLYTGEYEIYLYDKDLSLELAEPDRRTTYL